MHSEETCCNIALSTTNPTLNDPGSNPGPPVTNCFCYLYLTVLDARCVECVQLNCLNVIQHLCTLNTRLIYRTFHEDFLFSIKLTT
jgi:hypothetical protein